MELMKTDKTNVIFIMLGQQCNLSCKYCIQHSAIESFLPKSQINDDIFPFIQQCCDNANHRINLRFFGGEPLLYFKDIEEIIERTKDMNVDYSIITNGKMFNDEIVQYFNEHNVNVVVSWDGRNVDMTRHYDVMQEKFEVIKHLNHLCISGVLTANNYIEDFIDDAVPYARTYLLEHENVFGIVADEFMNIQDNKELTDIDYDKLNQQMSHILDIYTGKEKQTGLAVNFVIKEDLIHRYVNSKKCSIKYNKNKTQYETSCSNGVKMLNMDLQGNLYHCHNNWINMGTIYSEFDDYEYGIFEMNATYENFESACNTCEAYPICHGGCPLVRGKQREDYCKLKKAMINPIVKLVTK